VRALREDQDAAAALGVNTTRYKVYVFTITCAMAAAAGAVQAHYVQIITPNMLFLLQMSLVVAMAVIGGVENFVAAAIGAIFIQIMLEVLRTSFTIGRRRGRHDGLAARVLRHAPDAGAALLPQRAHRADHRAFQPRGVAQEPSPSGRWSPVPRAGRTGRRRPDDPSPGHATCSKSFGGNEVLKGVNFEINGPELIGLIGPNGAGKTTLTNILDGAIKPSSGTVYLNEHRIDQLQPYEVARAGLGRTFQVTRAFRRMTVLENLYVPALAMGHAGARPSCGEGRGACSSS
jgi:hypothetical protein